MLYVIIQVAQKKTMILKSNRRKGPPFNNYIKKASALINNTGEVENRAF